MSIRRVLGAVGLIVFVAIIAGLVAVGVHRHSNGSGSVHAPAGPVTGLPGPSTPVAARGLRAVSSTPVPELSVANRKYAMLLATGGCRGTTTLDALGKNGRKVFPLRSPAQHIVQVSALTATHAFVVGADAKCRLTRYVTVTSGITWGKAPRVGGVWTPTRDGVRGPSGAVGQPCSVAAPEPIALAAGGTQHAIVICRVGVFATTTGPTGWHPVGDLPGGEPAAITLLPNGHGALLLADQGYCLGLRLMTTTDTGHSWTTGPCLSRSHPPTAISINAKGYGLLLSQGQQYATADGGKTWTKYTLQKKK
jgi:hypothetical protein